MRNSITCVVILMALSLCYFTAKREKSNMGQMYAYLLGLSVIHLVFDALTQYTVNRIDMPDFSSEFNLVAHRIYYASVIGVLYCYYKYVTYLVDDFSKKKSFRHLTELTVLLVSLGLVSFLPIMYMPNANGNYSYGPAANVVYVASFMVMLLVIFYTIKNFGSTHPHKRFIIITVTALVLVCAVIMAVVPNTFTSSTANTLICLMFYLTIENPDIHLVAIAEEERKRAEEANRAKSIFVSNVSHEMRTPLNAIIGMTEIMQRTTLDAEQKQYLDSISKSGYSLLAIINDLLDFSKFEIGKSALAEKPYDPRALYKDIEVMTVTRIGAKPIQMICDIDEALPNQFIGDELKIRQLLLNLLNNSVKYTESGSITLRVGVRRIKPLYCEVTMSVIDTGEGIDKKDYEKIFQAFGQIDNEKNRGKEGTGLGLAICKEIVDMMNGKISVESEIGKGTKFTVVLRQRVPDKEGTLPSATAVESIEFIAPNARYLVVDDNMVNLEVAKGLMAPMLSEIDTADSAQTAYEKIKSKSYDIIFMDRMMPGIDGVAATEYIRSLEDEYYKKVPIVALTADIAEDSRKDMIAAGANDFLTKPIDTKLLKLCIKKWLDADKVAVSISNADKKGGDNMVIAKEPRFAALAEIGVNLQNGIRCCATQKLYEKMLSECYFLIDAKADRIQQLKAEGNIKEYTVEVHSMKSTMRMLGHDGLADRFLELEKAGKNDDWEIIEKNTENVVRDFRGLKEFLAPFAGIDAVKKECSSEDVIGILEKMITAVDDFELDKTDEAMRELEQCKLDDKYAELYSDLRTYVADVALDEIVACAKKMIEMLKSDED